MNEPSDTPGIMRLTVAICTWNRADLLTQTLDRMTRLIVPPDVRWELLVVNNKCTDRTDDVIASFAERLPIRRLFEPQPGQSNARNLAVSEAAGEYIIWTDDDVLVDEHWIEEYDRAFRRWPDATIFGGPIEPWFIEPPPRWLKRALPTVPGAYAIRSLGGHAVPLGWNTEPFGANMAMRTEEQRRYRYDPELGLSWARRHSELRGDETAVIHAMMADGARGWWVPGARVRHYIPRARQNTRYLRKFFAGYGEFCGRQAADDGAAKLFGRPRWYWRRAIGAELRYRVRRLVAAPEVWVDDLRLAGQYWGEIRGYASRPRT